MASARAAHKPRPVQALLLQRTPSARLAGSSLTPPELPPGAGESGALLVPALYVAWRVRPAPYGRVAGVADGRATVLPPAGAVPTPAPAGTTLPFVQPSGGPAMPHPVPAAQPAALPAVEPGPRVLAVDPIPAGALVLETMPGAPLTSHQVHMLTHVLKHDWYVAQIRSEGVWMLPNHDDPAVLRDGQVATAARRNVDFWPQYPGRASIDTDGTLYVSNGHQAARFIPAHHITDWTPQSETCPGCRTPYKSNGDGPCPGGRSTPTPDDAQATPDGEQTAPADDTHLWQQLADTLNELIDAGHHPHFGDFYGTRNDWQHQPYIAPEGGGATRVVYDLRIERYTVSTRKRMNEGEHYRSPNARRRARRQHR
ncbi:hypothetical protein [Streptomyces sp. NBC_00470]|uniref:hypothetical protein n=1 Tax=Streptomyces sp. NBC_00470 TaxID=2975753 RepID=UPI0030E0C3B8